MKDEKRETIRAFFAVDLDAAARAAAAEVANELRLAPRGEDVRWVRPEALHVTLCFLGEIDPARVEPLAANVAKQVAPLAPFRMELGAARLFPQRRQPRVVILDVSPVEPLVALAAAVDRGAVASGFETEKRPFRAHLTLGRVRGRDFPAVASSGVPEGTACEVTEAVLFQSELGHGGAKYTALEKISLAGASG